MTSNFLDILGSFNHLKSKAESIIKTQYVKVWLRYGKPHREDGPAVIDTSRPHFYGIQEQWYKYGIRHSLTDAAIKRGDYKSYYIFGLRVNLKDSRELSPIMWIKLGVTKYWVRKAWLRRSSRVVKERRLFTKKLPKLSKKDFRRRNYDDHPLMFFYYYYRYGLKDITIVHVTYETWYRKVTSYNKKSNKHARRNKRLRALLPMMR